MRCCRLYLPLTSGISFYFLSAQISLSRTTSAVWDVLANFLRLSIFISPVNYFFDLSEFYLPTQTSAPKPANNHSHSTKCQNTVTPESKNKREALSFWYITSTAVAWVCRQALRLSSAIKRLDCAPSSLVTAPLKPEPRCEAVLLYFSPRVPCFSSPCKLYAFHFVSCRTSLCDFLRLSATSYSRNPQPVNNPLFLYKTPFSPINTALKNLLSSAHYPQNIPPQSPQHQSAPLSLQTS
jgi:hypothetical protein